MFVNMCHMVFKKLSLSQKKEGIKEMSSTSNLFLGF
ncbi:hypothetical protein M7I_2074 [Glarea lozoyensis 74030]|uniref:Uncharacterized protein n=1 Tax=Glarea lozoyensis (strain ATCC 74030 / MF5533) TaxID=1104152 RepID=H0EHT6_GLAL7|nr:hypothetical protein M7I_2074 [Glarea lozoyensis 74030]